MANPQAMQRYPPCQVSRRPSTLRQTCAYAAATHPPRLKLCPRLSACRRHRMKPPLTSRLVIRRAGRRGRCPCCGRLQNCHLHSRQQGSLCRGRPSHSLGGLLPATHLRRAHGTDETSPRTWGVGVGGAHTSAPSHFWCAQETCAPARRVSPRGGAHVYTRTDRGRAAAKDVCAHDAARCACTAENAE